MGIFGEPPIRAEVASLQHRLDQLTQMVADLQTAMVNLQNAAGVSAEHIRELNRVVEKINESSRKLTSTTNRIDESSAKHIRLSRKSRT